MKPRRGGRGIGVAHGFGRGARDDLQIRDSGEGGAKLLGNAIGEIGLRGIAAEIGEGKDRDAVCFRRGGPGKEPGAGAGNGNGPRRTAGDRSRRVSRVAPSWRPSSEGVFIPSRAQSADSNAR
jgi:hypothetical protein